MLLADHLRGHVAVVDLVAEDAGRREEQGALAGLVDLSSCSPARSSRRSSRPRSRRRSGRTRSGAARGASRSALNRSPREGSARWGRNRTILFLRWIIGKSMVVLQGSRPSPRSGVNGALVVRPTVWSRPGAAMSSAAAFELVRLGLLGELDVGVEGLVLDREAVVAGAQAPARDLLQRRAEPLRALHGQPVVERRRDAVTLPGAEDVLGDLDVVEGLAVLEAAAPLLEGLRRACSRGARPCRSPPCRGSVGRGRRPTRRGGTCTSSPRRGGGSRTWTPRSRRGSR